MLLPNRISLQRILLGLIATVSFANAALADGGKHTPRVPPLPAYQQECAACHTAYPPGMLPAASWSRVMSNLSRHYGADASLEPATVNELSTWLAANAGTYKRVREEPPQDRLTLSAWFTGKHREVSAATWKKPAVKSAANCAACHPLADKGDFNEHSIRIPL
jgi:hypothetical protein